MNRSMCRRACATLLLLAAAIAGGANAWAAAGCGSIITHNYTPKWAWITIYDAGKLRHLDWGYVAPLSDREWRSGGYSCAGIYHVRAELKASEDPSRDPGNPPNIFDTTMQVPMGIQHDVYLKTPVKLSSGQAKARDWWYDSTRFWWDFSMWGSQPENTVPMFAWGITNETGLNVVFETQMLRPGAKNRYCAAPHAHVSVIMAGTPPYGVTVTPKTGACDSPNLGAPMVFGQSFQNGTLTYLGNFQIHGRSGTQSVTYMNMTTAAVEFATQAGVRCLAPTKSATLPASGALSGMVRLKTDCASSKVYDQKPFSLTVPRGQEMIVEYGLQLM